MVVIIPHQTEELKLIRLQKEVLQSMGKNPSFTKKLPLWLELPDVEIKSFAKNIKSVKLNSINQTDKDLFLEFLIKTENADVKAKLTLFTNCLPNSCKLIDIKKIPVTELKIFRLGLCIKNVETHSMEIEDSVWVKLT